MWSVAASTAVRHQQIYQYYQQRLANPQRALTDPRQRFGAQSGRDVWQARNPGPFLPGMHQINPQRRPEINDVIAAAFRKVHHLVLDYMQRPKQLLNQLVGKA